MKTTNVLLGIAIFLLAILLVLGIIILKTVKRNCNCPEEVKGLNLGLRTSVVYDSVNHRTCTSIWIDTLPAGQQGETYIIICNDCPEKEAKRVSKNLKKSTTTQPTKEVAKSVPPVKEEPVKRDSCPVIAKLHVCKPHLPKPVTSDTLKVEVKKVTPKGDSILYSNLSVLPTFYNGIRNKTEFNYDFKPDLHLQEYIQRAKTHLLIGTTAATVATIVYSASMFSEIPTFVEYNGLSPFDPLNKYYTQNLLSREHLRTLKIVRGVSVAVGVIGGIEIIHGICLLKNATLDIAPQRITLKYSF